MFKTMRNHFELIIASMDAGNEPLGQEAYGEAVDILDWKKYNTFICRKVYRVWVEL